MGLQTIEKQVHSKTFMQYLFSLRSIAAGLLLCALAVLLVYFASNTGSRTLVEKESIERTVLVKNYLNAKLADCVKNAQSFALSGDNLKRILSDSFFESEAHTQLFTFDKHGLPVSQASNNPDAPKEGGMRPGMYIMLGQALRGKVSGAFLPGDNELIVAAAVPASRPGVSAILLSCSFTQSDLERMGVLFDSEIILINPADNGEILAGTLPVNKDRLPLQRLRSISVDSAKNISLDTGGDLSQGGGIALTMAGDAPPLVLVVLPRHNILLKYQSTSVVPYTLAGGAALLLLLMFTYWNYRTGRQHDEEVSSFVSSVSGRDFSGESDNPLEEMSSLISDLTGKLKQTQAVAEKNAMERDEARRRVKDITNGKKISSTGGYKTFFSDAPTGFFIIRSNGDFLEVNQSLAYMMGFDSPAQMLSEQINLTAFCLNQDEAKNLLLVVNEPTPGSVVVALRKRDGFVRNFSVAVISSVFADFESNRIITGYITGRSMEEKSGLLIRERNEIQRRSTGLALLFTSTCRVLFAPLPSLAALEGSNDKFSDQADIREFKEVTPGYLLRLVAADELQGLDVHTALLDEVCAIALNEVQETAPEAVSVDIHRLVENTCRMLAALFRPRGLLVYCEVEKDMEHKTFGSSVLLRNLLIQSAAHMAEGMGDGLIYVSTGHNLNLPEQEDTTCVSFTVSYYAPGSFPTGKDFPGNADQPESPSVHNQDGGAEPNDPAFALVNQPEENSSLTAISPADRRSLLEFMLRKLLGELSYESFGEQENSLAFTVRLATNPLNRQIGPLPLWPDGHASGEAEDPADYAGKADNIEPESEASAQDSYLPLLTYDPNAPEDAVSEKMAKGLDILLIDDRENTRLLFSMFLKDTPHTITEAYDGQQGIDAIREHKFDVIFIEMDMPLMNGYQATRIIRALELELEREPTPIVAQAAHVSPDVKYQCSLAGCTEVLSKPFSKHVLINMLDTLHQLKRSSQG